MADTQPDKGQFPREDLYRAVYPGVELRDTETDGMPTLHGHFAVFDQPTEINSVYEGRFIETIAPGAFRKTLRENLNKVRVLFQHGRDPQIGDKPLGTIENAREDEVGAAYEVKLLDTAYNRELVPGLKAGLYGASFRFKVMKEELDQKPRRSTNNPEGLPERRITEAKLLEFGPVTFPAYHGATAGVRSITDDFTEFGNKNLAALSPDEPEADMAATHPAGSRDQALASEPPPRPTEPITTRKEQKHMGIDDKRARLAQIAERFQEIHQDFGADELDQATRDEWNDLKEERDLLEAAIKDYEQREAEVSRTYRERPARTELADPPDYRRNGERASRVPTDFWNLAEYRTTTRDRDEYDQALRDGAMRAVETLTFPEVSREDGQEQIRWLLDHADDKDKTIAQRVIATGSPVYHRAFGKKLAGLPLSREEDNTLERALGLGSQGGNYPVPVSLDPTVILTSNGVVNPLRAISRVIQISGNTWYGVASSGITASYDAEFEEVGDDSPTLTQPSANVEKAQAFVPFSIEAGEDWNGLQTEMARMFRDAKDTLEATKFLTGAGHGSHEPQGLLVGATSVVSTAATATFAVADLYSLKNALSPRYQPGAVFLANEAQFDKIRQFDTGGGANLWVQLGADTPASVLGHNVYQYSTMSSAGTTGASIVTYGDFSNFLIVDRVGLNVELIPHLFATANNRPYGARGLYAYWRNTSVVLNVNAFKTLKLL